MGNAIIAPEGALEAGLLPGSVECVRETANQLTVVDTGSQECIALIVQSLGSEDYHFNWADNFAAVRLDLGQDS